MPHRARLCFLLLSASLVNTTCGSAPAPEPAPSDANPLVGAWRSKIAFRSGPLAEMKDLQFLYVYNVGGTMTESSNYDEAANSSPPAYGVWRQVGPRTFETKYLFFTTKASGPGEGTPKGSDWWPDGHGVLRETITLSESGQAYTSTIKLDMFDRNGAPIAGVGDGTGTSTRITFQ